MNRLDFLKRLGIGAGAAIVVPSVLAQEKAEEYHNLDPICKDSVGKVNKLVFWQNKPNTIATGMPFTATAVT